MKKLKFLLVIFTVALQGFIACKSDDISPQPPPQKDIAQIQYLIKTYHLQSIVKPVDASKIIFLNNIEKASRFFEKIGNDTSPNFSSSTFRPTKNDIVLARGVFTFLNGENANIDFDTSIDGTGKIIDIHLDGIKVTFTQKGNYVEIQKWGTIALPTYEEEFTQLRDYQYYYVPIATYKAFLENNGWSSVQLLYTPEQANFEGEGGIWEPFYLNRNPSIPPTIAPWIPNHLSM